MDIYKNSTITPIILLFTAYGVFSIEFTVKLQRSQELCFNELTDKDMFTLISFESLNENAFISATIKENGSASYIFQSRKMEQKIELLFTTLYDNGITFCIRAGNNPVTAKVTYKSGPEARDYSMLAKNVHMSATESIINRVHDALVFFHRSQINASRSHDKSMKMATNSYNLLKRFFIFNCVMIIFSTAASAFYYKRFFIAKKII